jgi:hypothetical protein
MKVLYSTRGLKFVHNLHNTILKLQQLKEAIKRLVQAVLLERLADVRDGRHSHSPR